MINFSQKLECLTFLQYERNRFSLKNTGKNAKYIGQANHMNTVPTTILMCSGPISQRPLARRAVV